VCWLGLFYGGIGNEIGVDMALSVANKLNYAAAAAAVKAVKDDEDARLRAEQQEQNRLLQDDTTTGSATEGDQQDTTTSLDEAKGLYSTVGLVNKVNQRRAR